MKSLIIGANGGVGQHLVRKLKEQDSDFTAGVRKEEQIEALKSEGIDAVYIDVEKQSIEELEAQFKGYDQILFSVGSGGQTGADMTIIVDLDGAVKAIKASERVGHQHFVMVSTYDSRREAFDASGDLKPYTIAKHYADDYLRNANLKYTIVHPGALTNDKGTQHFNISKQFEDVQHPYITREDVAEVLVSVLSEQALQGHEFQIINGDLSLSEATAKYLEE
ncbi:NAD(P)-binding oxidoreductase [Staphylococcus sp. 17KM0847]|uniref:NAD(P)-binding oxidoreductase n=1 Tax=Staphylococcus sp. 17KM0847 TaxID=2583989 RepID=UPI0015DCF0B7|nr:NAD(P)-binding oxidoreductase [Staphylococcus sp. 17KM0847]QLK85245.1 SDR family oxidoreductase [Staphylococcus sp. 17KM0847]